MPDFTTIMAFIGPLLPFLLTLFPGLNAILKVVPKAVWVAMVKAVDPGATITWSVPLSARRDELEARRTALLAKVTMAQGTAADDEALRNINRELAALPSGTIIDTIKSNPLILVAIVGGIIFFVSQKGGCQKPATPNQPQTKPAVSVTHPYGGHSLASAQ